MWRRPACQTLSKAFNVSSASARVAQDLLKGPAIVLGTTVRRSEADQEDHSGNQKKGLISPVDQQSYYLQVFQRLY